MTKYLFTQILGSFAVGYRPYRGERRIVANYSAPVGSYGIGYVNSRRRRARV